MILGIILGIYSVESWRDIQDKDDVFTSVAISIATIIAFGFGLMWFLTVTGLFNFIKWSNGN